MSACLGILSQSKNLLWECLHLQLKKYIYPTPIDTNFLCKMIVFWMLDYIVSMPQRAKYLSQYMDKETTVGKLFNDNNSSRGMRPLL